MDKENYEKLKKFITKDYKIKKEMIDLRPPLDTDAISHDAIVKYTDNAYDSLRFIIRELKNMSAMYDDNNQTFSKKLEELSKIWINEFIKCKTDINKLRAFYKAVVTDMDIEVIDDVGRNCVGYVPHFIPPYAIKKSNTINEMLHIIHSFVMNNEKILKSLNVVKRKVLSNEYPVTIYGEVNDISMNLFKDFPDELDVGWTDIISFGDIGKVFMMVRDRGHALTIEIDYNEEDVLVNYFIPKICNAQMTNRLPGIIKVRENADPLDQTSGRFVTSKENLSSDIYRFIKMVPMDVNIIHEDDEYGFGRL